ncbi:MAG TPA: hypothetical protein VFP43_07730, partial [Mesorhizobium sp.]|nr:hypothetical protein [Mesorhizobium sp.]
MDPAVVDLAVKAFMAGGAAIGVPITPNEAEIVTPLVQCIADGASIPDCGKSILISKLPKETRDFVTCLTDGRDPGRCTQDQVFRQLPPRARDLAECLARQADAVECGKRFATTEAERAAAGAIDKLRTEVRNPLGEVITPIQNIVRVVDAIAREDWESVALNGGKAVAKYVIRIVLSTLLTQAGSFLAGPVIDTIIESRIDLAINLIGALKARDAPRISEVIVEAYLLSNVEITCALIPEGAVKEAICGAAGKIIGAIGEGAGQVTESLIGAVKDPLSVPGDLRDLISTTITGKDRNCGPAERVYADNFPICYHRAAYLKITDPKAYPEFDRWLNQTGCRDPFLRCHISKTVTRVCTPLHSMFNRHVDELARALTDTAAIYTRSFIPYMENNGFACDRDAYQIGIDRFIGECENALQKQIPLFGDGTWGNCRPGGAQQLWSKETAAKAACSKAVRQVALSPANVVNETDFAALSYADSFRWYAELYKDRICKPGAYDAEINNFVGLCAASLETSVSACGSPADRHQACRRALGQIVPRP